MPLQKAAERTKVLEPGSLKIEATVTAGNFPALPDSVTRMRIGS